MAEHLRHLGPEVDALGLAHLLGHRWSHTSSYFGADLISERGVIVRMQADAVPQQSRAATGVKLQRLDSGDRLSEVVLVPPAQEDEDALEEGATAETESVSESTEA